MGRTSGAARCRRPLGNGDHDGRLGGSGGWSGKWRCRCRRSCSQTDWTHQGRRSRGTLLRERVGRAEGGNGSNGSLRTLTANDSRTCTQWSSLILPDCPRRRRPAKSHSISTTRGLVHDASCSFSRLFPKGPGASRFLSFGDLLYGVLGAKRDGELCTTWRSRERREDECRLACFLLTSG